MEIPLKDHSTMRCIVQIIVMPLKLQLMIGETFVLAGSLYQSNVFGAEITLVSPMASATIKSSASENVLKQPKKQPIGCLLIAAGLWPDTTMA